MSLTNNRAPDPIQWADVVGRFREIATPDPG